MRKLAKLPPSKLATVTTRVGTRQNVADVRITGRKLQQRRWNLWKRDPHCAACGRFVRLDQFQADHIVPLFKGGPDTEENLQILCSDIPDNCHAIKTANDLGNDVQAAAFPEWLAAPAVPVHCVFGPPGSGKTTYVRERAGKHDVVVDVDDLISRISGLPLYEGTEEWMSAAIRLRNRIISRADRPLWFINNGASEKHREWWERKLLPESVTVLDVPLDECIRRIEQDERRPPSAKQRSISGARSWWAQRVDGS